MNMKQSFILSALVLALAGCSQLPEQAPAPISEVNEPVVAVEPELVENEVLNDHIAQAQATDFGHIFIDRDMSFIGTLPCEGCPGVKYHVNLFQDGKFEARQEVIDRHEVKLEKGTWLFASIIALLAIFSVLFLKGGTSAGTDNSILQKVNTSAPVAAPAAAPVGTVTVPAAKDSGKK